MSKEGSFFDPVLMDELVISSLPTQAPAPTGGSSASSRPHVTFQDQKQKEQKIIENERKLAEQMLSIRLRERKNESKEEEGRFSFAGYTNLKGTMTKVTVKKVNKKLGIAVDGGSNTKQKAVIVRQIVVRTQCTILYMYMYISENVNKSRVIFSHFCGKKHGL